MVRDSDWEKANRLVINKQSYIGKLRLREGIFIKDFPQRDPIIPEGIQMISDIISSSTGSHMNSSFLSTHTWA